MGGYGNKIITNTNRILCLGIQMSVNKYESAPEGSLFAMYYNLFV